MKKIEGSPTTLRKLLTGVKYTVHYYQREYQWGRKQMEELIEDLTSEFLEFYDENHPRKEVANYGHYFLGSIVLAEKDQAIITYYASPQRRQTSGALPGETSDRRAFSLKEKIVPVAWFYEAKP